ncbi:hypothetical protein NL676_022616 [Syzygium grande]|nr:hypothetical protein NL676_022616 [Syzygium grande]
MLNTQTANSKVKAVLYNATKENGTDDHQFEVDTQDHSTNKILLVLRICPTPPPLPSATPVSPRPPPNEPVASRPPSSAPPSLNPFPSPRLRLPWSYLHARGRRWPSSSRDPPEAIADLIPVAIEDGLSPTSRTRKCTIRATMNEHHLTSSSHGK